MTAFRQAVAKLQEGQHEETLIGLEFVLRLDPTFTPATDLRQQLASGAQEIDLSAIIGQLQGPAPETIDDLLIDAVESFNQRSFLEAKSKVETVLLELPGHHDARQLLSQIEDALKVENQVGQFLAQAREALDRGDAQEAANFVMMAQALDPHHSGIAPTLQEIYAKGGVPEPVAASPAPVNPADTVEFETSDAGPGEFSVPPEVPAPDAAADAVLERPDDGALSSDTALPWENSAAVDFGAIEETQQPVEAPQPPVEHAPPPVEDAQFSVADARPSAADVQAHDQPSPPSTPMEAEGHMAEPPSVEDVAGLFEEEQDQAPPTDDDDISDLFETDAAPAAVPDAIPGEQQVLLLMQAGEAAFESGDFLAAIDSWSRVYLSDPANITVSPRIEEARQQLEEVERRVEHLMFEAQEASLSGDSGRALELVEEVLGLDPRHGQATELHLSLTGSPEVATDAVAADAGVMPELDEDLFDEAAPAAAGELDDLALEWEEKKVRKVLGLPVRTLAIMAGGVVAGGILLWLVVGLLSGTKDASGEDVYELRARAEELFRQGNAEQALQLVEEFQITDPADQQVVDRLVAKYERALAPPTPTPIPVNLVAARSLMERGLFVHAYLEAMDGLARFPEDAALLELKVDIEQSEPMTSVLHTSLANSKYQTSSGIARDLLERYPQQADIAEVLERSLFNAALAELRVYNLTGATGYLRELDELAPNDDVVLRMLEFVEKYKARPVDMQLQVFIGSIDPRQRKDLLAADQPQDPPAAATATAAAPEPTVPAVEEAT
jgi:tetratricopeptide (TPR) repeat protein